MRRQAGGLAQMLRGLAVVAPGRLRNAEELSVEGRRREFLRVLQHHGIGLSRNPPVRVHRKRARHVGEGQRLMAQICVRPSEIQQRPLLVANPESRLKMRDGFLASPARLQRHAEVVQRRGVARGHTDRTGENRDPVLPKLQMLVRDARAEHEHCQDEGGAPAEAPGLGLRPVAARPD